MAELADRCATVVQRYGGTVDKFTGDGIMAVFGAPMALEDHAVRACLAALGVQEEAQQLAVDVQDRDGISLQVRVGLNSGQVIAGEIGSGLSVTPPLASKSVWRNGWNPSPRPAGRCSAHPPRGWSKAPRRSVWLSGPSRERGARRSATLKSYDEKAATGKRRPRYGDCIGFP
jgi:hypothetical protein